MLSVNAPGGNGEINLTGRLGYSVCAIEESGINALTTAMVFNLLLLISPFPAGNFILSPRFLK
jgi:hypothetical protein